MPSQFLSYSNNPKLGDTVIIYESQASMHTVVIVEGGVFQWRHGVLKHSTMTEHPYGTRYKSRNGNPDIFLLYPTPELWTINLPHRTQILYTRMITFVPHYTLF